MTLKPKHYTDQTELNRKRDEFITTVEKITGKRIESQRQELAAISAFLDGVTAARYAKRLTK